MQDEDLWVMAKVIVSSVYVDEFCEKSTSLRFAKIAYKRYVTSRTDLHGFSSLAAHS